MPRTTKATDPSDLPADEYLTPEEVLDLQHVLIDRRDGILAAAGSTVSTLTEQQVTQPDEMDQASSESDRDFDLRLAQRELKLISKLDHALRCIELGVLGVCETCGEPIGYRRLLARPVARMCIDCKTEAETSERIRAFK